MVLCVARHALCIAALLCLTCTTPCVALKSEVEEEADAHDSFLSWLEAEGLPEHNLELAMFENREFPGTYYRGLRTLVDVKHGDKILTIPGKFFMSKMSARASPLGEVLRPIEKTIPARVLLAIHLLHESQRSDSYWHPYLRVLPRSHSSLLFFSDDELGELQCASVSACPMLKRLATMRADLTALFDRLRPLVEPHFPDGAFTFDALQWAYATVASRAFSLNATTTYGHSLVGTDPDALGHTPVLVPLADMINHHNSVPALQFSYEIDDVAFALHLYADQAYAAGEQVFISYGVLTNPDLLITYGFVMTDNIYETVGLSVGLEEYDPLAEAKTDALKRRGLQRFADAHVTLDGEVEPQFVEALRVREVDVPKQPIPDEPLPPPEEASAQQLRAASAKAIGEAEEALRSTDFRNPVSGENEFRVYNTLVMNTEGLLRQYPTSLAEDLALLRGHRTLSRNAAMAVLLRVEIKRVLHAAQLEALKGVRRAYALQEEERYAGWARHVRELRASGDAAALARADRLSALYQDMKQHWLRGVAQWEQKWRQWRHAVDSVWGGEGTREERWRAFEPSRMLHAHETLLGGMKAGEGAAFPDVESEIARAVEGTLASLLRDSRGNDVLAGALQEAVGGVDAEAAVQRALKASQVVRAGREMGAEERARTASSV
mmetsp:Transcript_8899/g.28073  ORF Transcript_8899/g.28073 Transcript_8899/m.28073 type:complete len:665 (+) Transcript_8899:3-1997(+)